VKKLKSILDPNITMPTIRGKRFASRHLPSADYLHELLEKEQRENNAINSLVAKQPPQEKKRDCCVVM
jgi:hypothetical protein